MPFKVIQGHRFWYQSKAHMRLPISDQWRFWTYQRIEGYILEVVQDRR